MKQTSSTKETLFLELETEKDQYLQESDVVAYRKALEATYFHALQYKLIQKEPKLLWKLGGALGLFFWLISHINYDDGSSGHKVWAELDSLYRKGYLVTVRHTSHLAKEMGCSIVTVSRAVSLLTEVGFMKVKRNYTWGRHGYWARANLYIFGYVSKNRKHKLWFYHTASPSAMKKLEDTE